VSRRFDGGIVPAPSWISPDEALDGRPDRLRKNGRL